MYKHFATMSTQYSQYGIRYIGDLFKMSKSACKEICKLYSLCHSTPYIKSNECLTIDALSGLNLPLLVAKFAIC